MPNALSIMRTSCTDSVSFYETSNTLAAMFNDTRSHRPCYYKVEHNGRIVGVFGFGRQSQLTNNYTIFFAGVDADYTHTPLLEKMMQLGLDEIYSQMKTLPPNQPETSILIAQQHRLFNLLGFEPIGQIAGREHMVMRLPTPGWQHFRRAS